MKYKSLLLLILILVGVPPVLASAPPSCQRAASSKNGNFLVLRELQMEATADRSGGRKVQQVSFQVLTKTEFLNETERFTSAATYWQGSLWDVVLTRNDPRPLPACAVPLLSDDGEFLVLLNQHAVGPSDSALWIYRRRYHLGDRLGDGQETSILVRSVSLGEIWPADQFPEVLMLTDSTPLWFAGGSFDFSGDNRLLTHDTRWGNSVRISLSDGAVSKK
jgi:hypothetical protein